MHSCRTMIIKPTMPAIHQFETNTEHYNRRTHTTTAKYRGATHPMCFTNEVLEHDFPEGFKPVNIEAYDGTTDPVVWIEDFLLHIHMARVYDLHAIKYLPLKLKGQHGTG